VKGNAAGLARGWRYVGSNNFQPTATPTRDREAALRALSGVAGPGADYTVRPVGSGSASASTATRTASSTAASSTARPTGRSGELPEPVRRLRRHHDDVVHDGDHQLEHHVDQLVDVHLDLRARARRRRRRRPRRASTTRRPPPITNVQATALRMREGSTPAVAALLVQVDDEARSAREPHRPSGRRLRPGIRRRAAATGGGAVVTGLQLERLGREDDADAPRAGLDAHVEGLSVQGADSRRSDPADHGQGRLRARPRARRELLLHAERAVAGQRRGPAALGTGTTWCTNSPAKVGGTNDVTGKFVGTTKAPAPGVCPAVP
jgi:hypothetical protein